MSTGSEYVDVHLNHMAMGTHYVGGGDHRAVGMQVRYGPTTGNG